MSSPWRVARTSRSTSWRMVGGSGEGGSWRSAARLVFRSSGWANMLNLPIYPMLVGIMIMGMLPIIIVSTTAFLKISIVLLLVRNALGTQSVPSNMIIYVLSLILTIYVSAPLVTTIYTHLAAAGVDLNSASGLRTLVTAIIDPL